MKTIHSKNYKENYPQNCWGKWGNAPRCGVYYVHGVDFLGLTCQSFPVDPGTPYNPYNSPSVLMLACLLVFKLLVQGQKQGWQIVNWECLVFIWWLMAPFAYPELSVMFPNRGFIFLKSFVWVFALKIWLDCLNLICENIMSLDNKINLGRDDGKRGFADCILLFKGFL